MSAARTKNTYLAARYRRLARAWASRKPSSPSQHSILTAVWHMLTNDSPYDDLGGDFYTRRDPERALRRIQQHANALGFTVRFDPIPAT